MIAADDFAHSRLEMNSVQPEAATTLHETAALFAQSQYSALRRISTSFDGVTLTLRGQVPTYYLKQLAQTIALQLPAVREIRNRIEVDSPRSRRELARSA